MSDHSMDVTEKSRRHQCVWGAEGCTRNVCPIDPLETQQAAAKIRRNQQLVCPMLARVAGGGTCLDPDVDAAAHLTVALVEAMAIGGIGYRKALERAAACSRSARLSLDALAESRKAKGESCGGHRLSAVSGSTEYVEALANDYGMTDLS